MRRFLGLAALTTFGFGLAGMYFVAPPAYADKSIKASIAASCSAGQVMVGGTFTLTGVTAGQQITVNTIGARTFAPSIPVSNSIATYNVPFDAPLATPPAVATVPNNDWMGSFTLSSAQCVAAQSPTIITTVTSCGQSPVVLSVRLTNRNPILSRYTVTLNGFAAQTSELVKDESEDVTFQPLTKGANYTLTVVGAGTSDTRAVTVDSCTVTPPGPAPTTKAPPGNPTVPVGTTPTEPASTPESAEPTPSSSPTEAATSSSTEEDDPFATDSELLTYPIFWIGVSCIMVVVVGIVVAAILTARKKKP